MRDLNGPYQKFKPFNYQNNRYLASSQLLCWFLWCSRCQINQG